MQKHWKIISIKLNLHQQTIKGEKVMKKFYIILAMLAIAVMAEAQDDNLVTKKQQNIEALKVAFISRELELTPAEAQNFWPLYNQYSKELRTVIKEDQDIIDRDEKVLNLRKKYKDQFSKVIGQQRMNRMYKAEGKFRQLLIKSIRNQRQNQRTRPTLRRG